MEYAQSLITHTVIDSHMCEARFPSASTMEAQEASQKRHDWGCRVGEGPPLPEGVGAKLEGAHTAWFDWLKDMHFQQACMQVRYGALGS